MHYPGLHAPRGWETRLASPPTISRTANPFNNSTSNNYSFAGAGIGAADASRYNIVACCTRNAANVTGCTINGVAATLLRAFTEGVSSGQRIYFYGLNVPTGTSATIAYTLDANDSDGRIVVWRVLGLRQPLLPFSAFNLSENGPASATMAGSIWCPIGGIIIAVRQSAASAGTPSATWSGDLPEDLDEAYESNLQHTTTSHIVVPEGAVGHRFSTTLAGTLGVSRLSAISLI